MTSIEDLYSHSLSSANLRVEDWRPGDIDALIAAGWVRDGLATQLYRVRDEFDRTKGSWDQLERQLAVAEAAARVEFRSVAIGPTKAEAMREDAVLHSLQRRASILLDLKSLEPARQALGRFVEQMAARRRFDASRADLGRLAARVMEMLLDPLCAACDGTKFRVVPGTGRQSATPCGACGGTGFRRLRFDAGTVSQEVEFTRFVLAEVDRKMEYVNSRMRRFMRESGGS